LFLLDPARQFAHELPPVQTVYPAENEKMHQIQPDLGLLDLADPGPALPYPGS